MQKNLNLSQQQNNNKISFSFLIPNLGYSKHLFDCLSSIINQDNCSHLKYEVIVCDQSDQNTYNRIEKEILNRFGSSIVLIHSNVAGLFKARHTLMEHANGEYCFFCDSDDYVDPDFLMTIYDIICCEKKPDIILTYFKYCDGYGRDLAKQPNFNVFTADNYMDYFLFTSELNNVWMKTFKRSLYSLEDYKDSDWNVKNGEDFVFSYPLMKKANLVSCHFEVCKYHYRIVESSMTHRLNYELCRQSVDVKTKYIIGLSLNDFQKQIRLKDLLQKFSSDSQIMIRQHTITFNQFVDFVKIYSSIFNSEELSLKNDMHVKAKHKYIFRMIRNAHYLLLWFSLFLFSKRLKQ